MSEKKLALVEFHFHDRVQFGPRTIDGLGSSEGAGTSLTDELPAVSEEETGEPATADGGLSVVGPLVGLGVLAAVASVIRKLLSSESNGLDALDDIETAAGGSESADTEIGDAVSIEVTSGEDASAGRTGLAAAAVVALLLVLALVARKLLGDAIGGIEVTDESADE
jgi:hypothetical protein